MVQPDPVLAIGGKKKCFRPSLESFRHVTFCFEHLFTPGQLVFFLPSLFFFFFWEAMIFTFPGEWHLENTVWVLLCSLLLECRWCRSSWVCTASCTHLHVIVSDCPSLCTHLNLNSRCQIQLQVTPWKWLLQLKQFSFPLTPLLLQPLQ